MKSPFSTILNRIVFVRDFRNIKCSLRCLQQYLDNEKIRNMIGDVKKHLFDKKVHRFGAWATEIEMMTTAMFLNVDIYVCSLQGDKYEWRLFGKTGRFKDGITSQDRCLYLEHVDRNHFVAVTSVVPIESTLIGKNHSNA